MRDKHPRTGTRWYRPWRRGWPRLEVVKPYNDFDPNRLSFMPRIIAPTAALKLKMRLLGVW